VSAIANHQKCAAVNVDDRTMWRALIDHTQEEFGISRRLALREVAKQRRAAVRARDLQRAADIICARNWLSAAVVNAARSYCNDEFTSAATVIIVEGRKRPKLTGPGLDHIGNAPDVYFVTVGAAFVLKLARLAREVDSIEQEAGAFIARDLFGF